MTSTAASFMRIAAIILAGGIGSKTSSAAEICVTCSDPAATYRCALEGDDSARPAAPGALLVCIKELARRGGHTSCSVERTRAIDTCAGTLTVLPQPAANPLTQDTPADPGTPATTPSEPPSKPPATVEALAKDAAEQAQKDWEKTKTAVKEGASTAGEGVKEAGTKVGSAIKKSWDCLWSLFSSC